MFQGTHQHRSPCPSTCATCRDRGEPPTIASLLIALITRPTPSPCIGTLCFVTGCLKTRCRPPTTVHTARTHNTTPYNRVNNDCGIESRAHTRSSEKRHQHNSVTRWRCGWERRKNGEKTAKNGKRYSTADSRVIPHLSTSAA